jgi:hypothetical protein
MSILRRLLWALVNFPLWPFYALFAFLLAGMWLMAMLDPENYPHT